MAQQNQPFGIIELDIDTDLSTPLDDNISQTLRRLRCGGNAVPVATPPFEPSWQEPVCPVPDSVVALKADLGQLQSDLEGELARLLDQLLLMS